MNVYSTIIEEVKKEASAILRVAEQLSEPSVEHAFKLLSACKGKVVLTGMGKAGIIARKISATLALQAPPLFFACRGSIHGDLGMIDKGDVVIAVSNSGNTQELISIIPYLKFSQIPIIA
jgi:arabinose-5-phosphate isomerase